MRSVARAAPQLIFHTSHGAGAVHGVGCRVHCWELSPSKPQRDEYGHELYYTLQALTESTLFLSFSNRRTALEPDGIRQGLVGAVVLVSSERDMAATIAELVREHRGDCRLKAD